MLKLDDLLAHLRSVREMAARLTALKDTPAAPRQLGVALDDDARRQAASRTPRRAERAPARTVEDLTPTLQSMAERLAQDHAKRFKLTLNGLSEVPTAYSATIKDCLIQMLRNSAVHGIESPDVRRARPRTTSGTVRVDFRKISEGYELVFEDDGAGIAPEPAAKAPRCASS